MSTIPTGNPFGALAAFGVQAGPQTGEEIPIQQPVLRIGRSAQSDLVLPDDSVSTAHARLDYENGAWRLTDLGSTNGTYVESVRLAPEVPTPLVYGSSVRFGGVRLHFRPVAEADVEAARAEYTEPPPPKRIADEQKGVRIPVWFVVALLILLVLAALLFAGVIDVPVAPVNAMVSAGGPPHAAAAAAS